MLALRLATMFMHSRIEADMIELRLKMKNRIELELRRDWVSQHPTVSYWIEKERDWWEEIGVELSVRTAG